MTGPGVDSGTVSGPKSRSVLERSLTRLRHDPLGALARAFRKLVIERRRYAQGDGYDAKRYWNDRLASHGDSLRGPGDEGLPDAENRARYDADREALVALCDRQGVDFTRARVLEVGVGNGYYARALHALGTRHYCGFDISDVLFDGLRSELPGYGFECGDLCRDPLPRPFDLILVIEVLQHIVREEDLQAALQNLAGAAAPGGLVLVSGLRDESRRQLFNVHGWALERVRDGFPGFETVEILPFRHEKLLALRRAGSDPEPA